jgi:transposase
MRSFGLDVGRSFAELALSEPGRATRDLGRIEMSAAALAAFAASLGPDDAVALEASTNCWAIAELLARGDVGRVVVSNPLRTRAIADAKTKTDTIDARTLAELLAADYLPEVWQPDPATIRLRRLTSHRAALVRDRTAARNRVSAILTRHFLRPPMSDVFGARGRAWLAALELPDDERLALDSQLRLETALATEIASAEQALAASTVDDPRTARLLSIPGIGPVSVAGLLAVIGDIGRFSRPAKLVSYLGLDPRVRQSGGRPAIHGHISRAGQAHARWLLVEAAHASLKVPSPLQRFHARLRHRRGYGVAIVAAARKLAVIVWHVLHDDVDCTFGSPDRTALKQQRLTATAGRGPGKGGRRTRSPHTGRDSSSHGRSRAGSAAELSPGSPLFATRSTTSDAHDTPGA